MNCRGFDPVCTNNELLKVLISCDIQEPIGGCLCGALCGCCDG